MKRRDFLRYFSLGLVGPAFTNFFNIKKQSVEYLYPYVEPPLGVVPGLPNWYASVCKQCPAGCGIQTRVREGRAKKIEGNPNFPVNEGKLCARGQSGLQVLYNPDRLTTPLLKTEKGFREVSWAKAEQVIADRLKDIRNKGRGDKVAFLSDPLRGSLARLISGFAASIGSDRVYSYETFGDENVIAANKMAFNYSDVPHYDIANSTYIVSLGTPFLDTWNSPVKYSVGYGKMRDPQQGRRGQRGWLVQFEPRLTTTGANADQWFPIKPGTEGLLAMGMARIMVEEGLVENSDIDTAAWNKVFEEYPLQKVARATGVPSKEIEEIAKAFAEASAPLAICGGQAAAHTNGSFNVFAAAVLNYLAGSVGRKGGVLFPTGGSLRGSIEKTLSHRELLKLFEEMGDGGIEALFIRNNNLLHTLPHNYRIADKISRVPLVISITSFMDETSEAATLVLPESTYLESWGDYIPITDDGRGTIGLMQPIVENLHKTKSAGDIFLSLARNIGGSVSEALPYPDYYTYLKNTWNEIYQDAKRKGETDAPDFDKFWEESVARGGFWLREPAFKEVEKKPQPDQITELVSPENKDGEKGEFEFHLLPYLSVALYDGRGANQPWLQQLPEPLVTATWGTWAEINPETAKELGVKEGDILQIETATGQFSVPAYLFHGVEPKTIAVPIGQGHKSYGRYAKSRGRNPIRSIKPSHDAATGAFAWADSKVNVTKGLGRQSIVKTEPELELPGIVGGLRELDREIVQWMPPEAYGKTGAREGAEELDAITALPTRDLRKGPRFLGFGKLAKYRESRYQKYKYRWGMVIDLDKCTGCSACMVACYAENNQPIVSPDQLQLRRHRNWIRVDRYWEGEYPNIRAKAIPINCFQCGNAPCEPVCPVYAAYHTKDGLNGQVYQRCVGTRFCNANCPYRSRLFNWLNAEWPEPLNMQLNPDVSVRYSGVTDKCSFCVQRIREAKDLAKDDKRRVRDGEIQTACSQTCPSGAITFGDLLDPESRVSKLTRDPRRYRVLEEMGTEPAVIYLKAVRRGAEGESEGGHAAEGAAGGKAELE